jgi:hypothetical protein
MHLHMLKTKILVRKIYVNNPKNLIDDQWRYSPDRALASLTGFMIVCRMMWGYQLHDRPVLDTRIQPSEISSSNYQRVLWRSRETRVRNGR